MVHNNKRQTKSSKKYGVKIGIIGGSGLDDPQILKNARTEEVNTPYGAPASPLTIGEIDDTEVVILSRHGHGHTITPTNVPFRANLSALKEAGVTHILATTACGSLKKEIKPRDLIFLDQFIDFTKLRTLTFHDEKVVHTPMADPFCPDLRRLLATSAKKLKISAHNKGTMVTIEGPRFSTRAESFMFKKLGADVINMSTVPETSLARELGICYASIAMATDYDCWHEGEESVTFELVMEVMKDNAENVKKLLINTIPKIKKPDCSCRV